MFTEQLYRSFGVALACTLASVWHQKPMTFTFPFSLTAAVLSVGADIVGQLFFNGQDRTLLFLLLLVVIAQNLPGESDFQAIPGFILSSACYCTLWTIWGAVSSHAEMSSVLKISISYTAAGSLAVILWTARNYFPAPHWLENIPSRNIRAAVSTFGGVWFGLCLLPYLLEESHLMACVLLVAVFLGGLAFLCLLIRYLQGESSLQEEKQYANDLQAFMYVIRSQRHDYNLHVQTLQSLLQSENYAECQTYLNQLLKDSTAMNAVLPLADPAVSALIHSFMAVAEDQGIVLHPAIENDLSHIATSVYETNKIIGNLLQNAIDETVALPDKSYGVHLSIIKRGEFCLIQVSNRVGDAGQIAGYRSGISSKQGHEGIGLAATRVLVSRYQGAVYSQMDGDIVTFIAKVPLKIREEAV